MIRRDPAGTKRFVASETLARALTVAAAVRLSFAAVVAGFSLTPPIATASDTVIDLYQTGFEEFPVGDDQLVGNDGWEGDNTGEGVHGIDQDVLPGIGRSAFLGFNPPSDGFVRVHRPVDYDPIAEGTPTIDFFALVGVQESTSGGRDVFYVTVLNSADQVLAGIRLRSTALGIEVARFDGVVFDVIVGGLDHGVLEPLFLTIDYPANTWSASWGGVGLFLDAPFTSRNVAHDLGSVAVEWQPANPVSPGNNWLLVDEWILEASGSGVPVVPPAVVSASRGEDGRFTLSWTVVGGLEYQVEYSLDLVTWHADLPGSRLPATVDGTLEYSDDAAVGGAARWYRIAAFAP